ncbi:MAG: carboxypeptidase-like regulatory domain-containing protein [bacterium]|nr:carboxypeptidase-like regulatory domain-containing protein [bacterium]
MKKILVLMILLMAVLGCKEIKKTTISGTVTNGGSPVSGAIVLLLESDLLTAGMSLKNGTFTSSEGKYEIIRVESGIYYIPAIKDENGNWKYDNGTDMFGWYGERDTLTSLTIPAPVAVTEGDDLTGIDIDTLYVVP